MSHTHDDPSCAERRAVRRWKRVAAASLAFSVLVGAGGIGTRAYAGALIGDLNGDGSVGIVDLSILLTNWGKTAGTGATPTSTPNQAGTVTPLDFGAKGDGASDDTAALQKAIDGAGAKTLVIPTGKTFARRGVLYVHNAGTHITGPGIILATNEGASGFIVQANNVTIDGGLTIRTTGVTKRWTAPDQDGLALDENVDGFKLANVTIDGSAAAGFISYGASHYTATDLTVQNTWADCIHNTNGSAYGQFVRPTSRNCGDDGMAVVSYSANKEISHDITFESPKFLGQTNGRGFSVVGGNNVTFNNVYGENSSAAMIYIGCEGGWNSYGTNNVSINGGTIKNSNQGSEDHGAIFILSSRPQYRVENVTIQNLAISGTNPAKSRQYGLIQYGGAFSKVLFKNLAFTGGGGLYQGNGPDSAYNSVGVTKDGKAVADHIGY